MGYILTATTLLVGARLLSFVAWLCITPQLRRPPRSIRILLLVAVLLLMAKFAPTLLRELTPMALALLYFAALVPTVHALAGAWSPVGWSGFAISLSLALAVSIILPMHLVTGAAKLAFVARGFEFALAAHSYLADSRRLQARGLRQCLFFLLVNPVLVFHQFGKRMEPATASLRHIGRCAIGIFTIAAYFSLDLLIDRLPFTTESMDVTRIHSLADYGTFVAATALLGVGTYLAHSGTASVQIGAMRLAGYVTPERYNYPFLAVTPADWWRRWNIYVGSWFTAYCLLPSTIFFRRQAKLPPVASSALSVMTCFVISGVVHAAASTSTVQVGAIISCFVAQAILVLSWLGAAALAEKLERLLPGPMGMVARRIVPLGSWAARVQLNMIILSVLFPMLSGGQDGR